MTFKGVEYQTILDIERCLFVAEAEEKALQFQLKTARLQREKELIEETVIRLEIQQNFINELNKLIEELLEKIDKINETTNDVESKIFIGKFVENKSNQQLMEELYISSAVFFRYIDSIDRKLKCEDGEELKTALS